MSPSPKKTAVTKVVAPKTPGDWVVDRYSFNRGNPGNGLIAANLRQIKKLLAELHVPSEEVARLMGEIEASLGVGEGGAS